MFWVAARVNSQEVQRSAGPLTLHGRNSSWLFFVVCRRDEFAVFFVRRLQDDVIVGVPLSSSSPKLVVWR
jgi:hypothetical protein